MLGDPAHRYSRRTVLKGSLMGLAGATLGVVAEPAWRPVRLAHAAPTDLPSIQFDIGSYLAPVETIDGIQFHFGPVFTLFLTARLRRAPARRDQTELGNALDTIEQRYPFSPTGVFPCVAYGLPYFQRLPGGLNGPLVAQRMPRLLAARDRYVLEEAIPGPTDVSPANPGVTKKTFNVPVRIEDADVLFTLRSDALDNLQDVSGWLQGSNRLHGQRTPSPAFGDLFTFQPARVMCSGACRGGSPTSTACPSRAASTRSRRCGWASRTSR